MHASMVLAISLGKRPMMTSATTEAGVTPSRKPMTEDSLLQVNIRAASGFSSWMKMVMLCGKVRMGMRPLSDQTARMPFSKRMMVGT